MGIQELGLLDRIRQDLVHRIESQIGAQDVFVGWEQKHLLLPTF